MPRYGPHSIDTGDEAFKSFAFTGIRELVLWLAFHDGVYGNDSLNKNDSVPRKLGNVTVWTNFSQRRQLRNTGVESLDFAAWLEWCKKNQKATAVDEATDEESEDEDAVVDIAEKDGE